MADSHKWHFRAIVGGWPQVPHQSAQAHLLSLRLHNPLQIDAQSAELLNKAMTLEEMSGCEKNLSISCKLRQTSTTARRCGGDGLCLGAGVQTGAACSCAMWGFTNLGDPQNRPQILGFPSYKDPNKVRYP